MCRYGEYHYKEHFACFTCRKVFRRPYLLGLTDQLSEKDRQIVPCPECKRLMVNIGKDFKTPKQSDKEQWKKAEKLVKAGYSFHSCGCVGPGYRPVKLKEVDQFVQDQDTLKREWKRQRMIVKRAEELTIKRNKRRKALVKKRMEKATEAPSNAF